LERLQAGDPLVLRGHLRRRRVARLRLVVPAPGIEPRRRVGGVLRVFAVAGGGVPAGTLDDRVRVGELDRLAPCLDRGLLAYAARVRRPELVEPVRSGARTPSA